MADVGVVLRVPEVTHAKLKAGCAKHDRSMQKVLVALIEGWVANGAPDPSTYGQHQPSNRDQAGIDHEARANIIRFGEILKKLSARVDALEEQGLREKYSRRAWENAVGILSEYDDENTEKPEESID